MKTNLALQRDTSSVLVLLLLFSFLIASVDFVSTHILNTRIGALEGVRKEARHQKYFHAYYGIPYAKPPVGKLRFEPPVEAEPWSGTLNATQPPPPCPQLTDLSDADTYVGQEDCTFLHVYTPVSAKPGANLPVLFYVIGGQFRQKKPTDYEPDFIMSRDLVLVMVSYRLGMLGFLSTGDTVISGNMGLKDQLMAMKWTKENIYDFGGDPNRITLQGHSSGAMCVHLHTMSPLSKDYFNQVIMQSGFSFPPSIMDQDFARGVSRALAAYLNCSEHTSQGLKKCLRYVTARELVLATEKLVVGTFPKCMYAIVIKEAVPNLWYPKELQVVREEDEKVEHQIKGDSALKSAFKGKGPTQLWLDMIEGGSSDVVRPVIEDERVENAFLKGNPLFLPYQSVSKPLMLGITSGEAASFVTGYFTPGSRVLDIDPKILFPIIASLEWSTKSNYIDFIVQLMRAQFFGEGEVNTTDTADVALVKILTGISYGSPLMNVVQNYEGPKYVYLFDYRYVGGFSHSKGGRNGRFVGVAHADEVPLIFKENKTGIAEQDFRFGDEIITRWVNFVYSGNPNSPFPIDTNVFGAWKAVSTPRIEFLRINRNGGMESNYFWREYGIWKKIPLLSKYYNS